MNIYIFYFVDLIVILGFVLSEDNPQGVVFWLRISAFISSTSVILMYHFKKRKR